MLGVYSSGQFAWYQDPAIMFELSVGALCLLGIIGIAALIYKFFKGE